MENAVTPAQGQEEKTIPLGKALLILGAVVVVLAAAGLTVGYLFFWDKYQHQTYEDIMIRAARQQVKANPKSATAHLELGYAYLLRREAEKALAEYKTAHRLDPQNRQVRYNLALGYMANKDYPEAIKLLKPLAKEGIFDLEAHFSLGEAYYYNKQYAEAVKAFSDAAAIRPGLANTYYFMALSYEKMGDKENAIAACDKALRLVPTYKDALSLKAKLTEQPAGGKKNG
ncbi:MAG: tetratricopeptide repeat protein [Bacillota bacterium]